MKPKFIMLVGLPGSGKSTYAATLAEKGYRVHSSDAIRKELFGTEESQEDNNRVFSILHKRVIDDLKNGNDVVYDATNIKRKLRTGFLDNIRKINCEKTCLIIMCPYLECLKRNAERERKVPESAIKRMYFGFQPPSLKEGWDRIEILVDSGNIDYFSINYLFNNASGIDFFNQFNSHHKHTLGAHSRIVSAIAEKECPSLKYVSLIHDVGKLSTQTNINAKGEIDTDFHYYNHNSTGAYDSILYMINDTDYDSHEIMHYSNVIYYHMTPYNKTWNDTPEKISKIKRRIGDRLYNDVIKLHEFDLCSHEEDIADEE